MNTEDQKGTGKIMTWDVYLAQIEIANRNSQVTFGMLQDILAKFFPHYFI